MSNIIIVSVLLGAALGRFFKVWILVPVCMAILAVGLTCSVIHGHGILYGTLESIMAGTALQLGYVFSLVLTLVPGLRKGYAKASGGSRQTSPLTATRQRSLF